MRIPKSLPVLALALLGAAPGLAQSGQRVRLQGLYVHPSGDLTDEGLTLEADDAFGARVAWELLFTDRIGLEVGLATSEHDLVASIAGFELEFASTRLQPLTASLLVHLTPADGADVYFGGGLAHVRYDDLEVRVPDEPVERVDLDDNTTWQVQAGVDVAVGAAWGLSLGLQYVATEATFEGGDESENLPIEPLVAAAGVVFRF
jgi:outer membrane protein W